MVKSGAPAALTRFDHAVNAALLLSFVAQQTGDRTGVLCFGDQIIRYLPPRPGRRSFLALTHALHDVEPELNEPDYGMALRYLATRNTQRSLLVVFTDVTEPEAAAPLIRAVQPLTRRHLCLVVTMRDPDLVQLANMDPIDTKSVHERAVARVVLDRRERTLRLLRERGVLTLDAVADKISAEAVNHTSRSRLNISCNALSAGTVSAPFGARSVETAGPRETRPRSLSPTAEPQNQRSQ